MVSLKFLLEAYNNNALKIDYEAGASRAIIGGVADIDLIQADVFVRDKLGWTEYRLSPFEIIDKTQKFVRAIKTHIKDEYILNNTSISFKNKPDSEYGRTFDRIELLCPRYFHFSIIYNMKSAGASYVLYETGNAIPKKKFRNLKQVMQYLDSGEYSNY